MSKLYTERRHMKQRDKVNKRAENHKQAMRQQIRLKNECRQKSGSSVPMDSGFLNGII